MNFTQIPRIRTARAIFSSFFRGIRWTFSKSRKKCGMWEVAAGRSELLGSPQTDFAKIFTNQVDVGGGVFKIRALRFA
jgi:hypothetical protein